ncbi:MAG TPA: SPOR domain-containing protein [Bryobacteraceae bacterium]
MLRKNEGDREILLQNRQLLGIFFAVVVLLGVAFTGGYVVGKGSAAKKQEASPAPVQTTADAAAPIGETHSIPAAPVNGQKTELPGLTRRLAPEAQADANQARQDSIEGFTPQHGERFLQVAAVSRDEADTVADVLRKKGFRAHAVQKPGNGAVYRVLIGPIQSAGELSKTRDALRRTGFTGVFTRRY